MAKSENKRSSGTLPVALAENPQYAIPSAVLMAIAGAVLMLISANRDRLWWVVLWFVLGIALLSVSLLYVNDELAERLDGRSAVPRSWWALFGGLAVVGVAVLATLMQQEGNPALATVFVVVTAVGMIGLHVAASLRTGGTDDEDEDEDADASTPGPIGEADGASAEGLVADAIDAVDAFEANIAKLGRRTHVGIALLALGVIVVAAADGFGGWSWLALVVWMIGLILVKIGVVPFLKSRNGRMRPTMLAMGAASVVAVVGVYLGAVWSSQLLLLTGLSAVVVALSVLGLAAVHCECPPVRSSGLIIGGGVAVIAVTAWVVTIVNGFGLGVVVSAFVWGIGTWYVFRGEGIVLILLIGYIAVWGLIDRTADVDTNPHDGAPIRMLALGDSFISGEGADEYFAGTNVVGDDRNECRRASTAYPYLVADDLGYSLDFVACSGAKARDLTVCGQMAPADARCTREESEWDEVRGAPDDRPAGARPQLANFTADELMEFDVVLLSIGGNDVGFSTIVKACLLPKGCEERGDGWLANVEDKGDLLVDTYERVKRAVPATTPIIVMPYPMLVTAESCGLGLSAAEHEFVVRFISTLDGEIRAATEAAGVHFFEQSVSSFDGVQLCDRPAGANHLQLAPPSGDWVNRYQPGAWVHNSMHPNELGHERIAERLTPFLAELMAGVAGGDPANPVPVAVDAVGGDLTSTEEVDAAVAADVLSDGEWVTTELYRTVRALVLPLALLLAAGIVLGAGVVRKNWWLGNALRPRDADD
jgi:lysophospholipase L1-like esterase